MNKSAFPFLLIFAVQIYTLTPEEICNDEASTNQAACNAKEDPKGEHYCCYIKYKTDPDTPFISRCQWAPGYSIDVAKMVEEFFLKEKVLVSVLCSSNYLIASALFVIAFLF